MRRNRPEESGSLSSIPKDESQFTIGSSGETGLRDTDTASGVVVAAVLFSRFRYGQFCIVVRGQDVGCGCGWWQHDLLCVPETCPSGHAIAGQTVAMLTSITAITNATAVLIIEVDVPKWVLVGGILTCAQRQAYQEQPPAAYNTIESTPLRSLCNSYRSGCGGSGCFGFSG